MNHQLANREVAEVERKLSLPVERDENGKVLPTKFTDREMNFIVFVKLQKLREENEGFFVNKHWTKMSKKERKT